jgi:RNA polymerase sigma-70 factor (ECF subfamily)
MIETSARESWVLLTEKLRAFVGRRVPAGDVDDVVQDVLLRIHKNIQGLHDETRFGPWVYRIARNAVVDRLRQRPAPVAAGDVEAIEALEALEAIETIDAIEAIDADAVESPAPEPDAQPLVECVASFVARLPAPYRDALTLVELRGLTQQAAADIAGVSLSGMKSRVQRGRRLMREMFEACCALTLDGRRRVIDAEPRDDACGCGGREE